MTIEKKKLRYVPAKDLVKIARAGNRQAVRRTISGIQAQINQLKSGSGDRRTKAVLVKQAEQVLLKAKLKDKLLKKEEILQLQQKKAAKKAEYEKSLRLKLLLKKKREGRKAVSYTHLDVYKRQLLSGPTNRNMPLFGWNTAAVYISVSGIAWGR